MIKKSLAGGLCVALLIVCAVTGCSIHVDNGMERQGSSANGSNGAARAIVDGSSGREASGAGDTEPGDYYQLADSSERPDLPMISYYVKHGDRFYDALTAENWHAFSLREDSGQESTDTRFYVERARRRYSSAEYVVPVINRSDGDELAITDNVNTVQMYSILGEAYVGDFDIFFDDVEELNGVEVDQDNYSESLDAILAQSNIWTFKHVDYFAVSETPTTYSYGYYSNDAKWIEGSVEINRPALLCSIDESNSFSVPVIKSKQGYFTIDISNLASGRYLISTSQSYYCVEIA